MGVSTLRFPTLWILIDAHWGPFSPLSDVTITLVCREAQSQGYDWLPLSSLGYRAERTPVWNSRLIKTALQSGQTTRHLCTTSPPSLKWISNSYFRGQFPGFRNLLYLKHSKSLGHVENMIEMWATTLIFQIFLENIYYNNNLKSIKMAQITCKSNVNHSPNLPWRQCQPTCVLISLLTPLSALTDPTALVVWYILRTVLKWTNAPMIAVANFGGRNISTLTNFKLHPDLNMDLERIVSGPYSTSMIPLRR